MLGELGTGAGGTDSRVPGEPLARATLYDLYSWLQSGNGVLSKHNIKVSIVKNTCCMKIYRMVEKHKVSESARLAGKT